jgi:hypothetical protein
VKGRGLAMGSARDRQHNGEHAQKLFHLARSCLLEQKWSSDSDHFFDARDAPSLSHGTPCARRERPEAKIALDPETRTRGVGHDAGEILHR